MKEGKFINTSIKICEQLQATNSTKEKEAILRSHKNNEGFKKVLKFLLDPHIITGISKKKIVKSVGCQGSPVNSFFDLLEYLCTNNSGRDEDIATCRTFIDSLQSEADRAFYEMIITKSLRLGCDGKTVNKCYGKNFISEFEIQQAYSIEKYPLKQGEWFSLSEKANGCRGVFVDGKILSRQGKEISGLQHIIFDLERVGLQNYFVDGELKRKNIDGLSDNENFRIGTGIINSESSSKPEIYFIIFDAFPIEEYKAGQSAATYKERKERLKDVGKKLLADGIVNLDIVNFYYEGTDRSQIDYWLDVMVSQDKEGLMLNKDVPYKCKRHSGILKVKRFYTCDLKVLRLEEGSGRLTGTLGAFIVDYKGNNLNVGSGLTDEQRKEFWSQRDSLIGRVIEVKYKEETQDKKTGARSLQFPIFVMLREEGKAASYN